MKLSIDLTPALEARLRDEAKRQGVAPEVYAVSVLERQLRNGPTPLGNLAAPKPAPGGNSLSALFTEWAAEDATDDPEEIARRQREWEELKRSINANHGSYREPIP